MQAVTTALRALTSEPKYQNLLRALTIDNVLTAVEVHLPDNWTEIHTRHLIPSLETR